MRSAARNCALGAALILAALSGCSGPGLKTHPVSGKVELKDGDVALLMGSSVEFQQEADDTVRPIGNIDGSGAFAVKTLHRGEIVEGAPEGSYKARIILADQTDDGIPKRPANLVHPRYFDFEKSGLKYTVPSPDYKVPLAKKK
jgi:hypothetical protein